MTKVKMIEKYSKLFEPINIGKVRIKNRIAMAPMGIVGLTDSEGSPTQRAVDYYIERAKGGVGLIITSLFKVDNNIEVHAGNMELITRKSKTSFGELCDVVHSLGTKIFIQLTAGFGRVSIPHNYINEPVSASASPNYFDPDIICRPLKTEEVETLVKSFGDAAEVAAISGMDGIELHGHEGYILDQFTTSIWNNRTDKYGGDLQGRLTFPVEVLREIKKRLGDDFPVQYRFGLKHYIKGLNSGALKDENFVEAGRDIEEGLEMAKLLEDAGFDSLHIDAGCYDSWYWAHPPSYQEYGCMADMAAKVKRVVKIPVTAVGKLDIPELADEVIKQGKADLVALGRGLLADPYWPNKVRQRMTEDIRPCIGCHSCLGRFATGRPLSCAVNPMCGRETLSQLKQADKPTNIMVIGGGIAGMEAARVATLRKHKVTIYEKGNKLGGHIIEASIPAFKQDLRRLASWYEIQIDKLGIEVKFETEVTPKLIEKEMPEVLIIATGSRPIIPDIAGNQNKNVCTCEEILLGKCEVGKKNIVVGGGLMGCETALWLAQNGKDVTIVEQLPELMLNGPMVAPMNKTMLIDLLSFEKVEIVSNNCLKEITNEGIFTEDNNFKRKFLKADTVVLAIGMKAENKLYEESLLGKVARVFSIGDCREIRNIYGAVWDGFEVGRLV